MSLQVFLQGRILGTDSFLSAAPSFFEARAHWTTLLSEVIPRALLQELGLARILLGSSGSDQFLVVIPKEALAAAEGFLEASAAALASFSGGVVSMEWAATENLGDWSDIRKRITEEMRRKLGAPARRGLHAFAPFHPPGHDTTREYFSRIHAEIRSAAQAGWSLDVPGQIRLDGGGKHVFPIGTPDGIPLTRHVALDDNDLDTACPDTLGARAKGRPAWGVLRGDVDNVETRFRRAQNIEEHIQLSFLYRQFFAGELEVLCLMPDFWRKVTLLYTGGDEFAVFGAWDALITLAREVERLFARFAEENLKDFPGAEGKTITMALAIAREKRLPIAPVYHEAGLNLAAAKATAKDSISLLGRTLEWKQLGDAQESKETMARMITEFGCAPQFLFELASFYRDAVEMPGARQRGRSLNVRVERPWRFHRRLNRVIAEAGISARNKEFQKLRADLIADFTGRKAAQVRLRPSGRVALEWARLETES